MKLLSVVGARPQFIKVAQVSRASAMTRAAGSEGIEHLLVHTGQHYDDNMSRIFFEELDIPEPDYHLGIGSGSHGAQTGQMLEAIEQVLVREKPRWVLVYGDTNSTFAGALAAAKLHLSVAHVEAGLRSFIRAMPEEVNRVLTDHVSDLLFCPTEVAVNNLEREGITRGVHLVGDVMYDSILRNVALSKKRSHVLSQLHLEPKSYALATVHRAENTDDPQRLEALFTAFEELTEQATPVVCPLHPRTREALAKLGLQRWHRNLSLIDPIAYLDMLLLLENARLVLTDSGGVQKEAFILQVPCLTLRDTTEWVETVEAGWNILTGADKDEIVAQARTLLEQGPPPVVPVPYGDGRAAERIVSLLVATGSQRE